MVLRYLLNRILNNPQIIDKIAESYPIRRAAQLTAYALQRGKVAAEEALESETKKQVSRFSERFKEEIQKGFKEIEQGKQKK